MHTTVTTRGQIALPTSLRRKLGIKPGTRVHIQSDESTHRIILTPITRSFIESIRGKYRSKPLMKTLLAEKRAKGTK